MEEIIVIFFYENTPQIYWYSETGTKAFVKQARTLGHENLPTDEELNQWFSNVEPGKKLVTDSIMIICTVQ